MEKTVKEVSTPWGWVGYSQGCANAFRAESMMLQAGCPCETAGGSWSMVGLGFMAFVKYKVYSTQLHTRTHSTLRYVMLGYVPFRSVTLHTSIWSICVYNMYMYIYIYIMHNFTHTHNIYIYIICAHMHMISYDMSYVEFYIILRFWTFPANPQGTLEQQRLMSTFRCRQLLFSAANGSAHATCGDWKLLRALVDGERFLKRFQVWSIPQTYDVMTTL